jgi:hypothetical protein
MKKLVFAAVAFLAVAVSSCNQKSNSAASETDSTSVVDSATAQLSGESQATFNNLTGELLKDIQAKDFGKVISSLANLQVIYKNLVSAGKLDEALAFGSTVKNFITENESQLKAFTAGNATVASLINGIKSLPTDAGTTADAAKSAVSSAVSSLAAPSLVKGATSVATAEAAAEAVSNVPAAVKNAVTNAGENAISSAKAAVQEKVNSEVNSAKEQAASKVNEATQKATETVDKVKKAKEATGAAADAAKSAAKSLGF